MPALHDGMISHASLGLCLALPLKVGASPVMVVHDGLNMVDMPQPQGLGLSGNQGSSWLLDFLLGFGAGWVLGVLGLLGVGMGVLLVSGFGEIR